MKIKEFKLTNIAVINRVTVYFILVLLIGFGTFQYYTTPKEAMPEITFPFFMVNTIFPGTSPSDMENLITKPLETELKGIDGIDNIKSQSIQDFSSIFIEFQTSTDETQAYLDIREAVDKAGARLPDDLPGKPDILRLEIDEQPVLVINLSGDMGLPLLKEYAKDLQEKIEQLEEINRVDIVGALDREILVNVDLYKMQAAGLTLFNIEEAIRGENLTISGGELESDGLKKNLRVLGEFKQVEQIADILLKKGVYIRDIATVVDGFANRKSYARLNGKDVVALNVIKKGGKNLIYAIKKIDKILAEFKTAAPPNLVITKTGDMSIRTETMLGGLFNTLLLGLFVVVLVLMFFMGTANALFAAAAIPISILITFIFVPLIGFTLNNVVMIALIVVLGILVDNSVVIVENIYRHYKEDNTSILEATRTAVGEVAMPVLGGTLTTMAPFVPLMFWSGITGKFFLFIPVTILIALTASLLVAYIMNPVFAVSFMKFSVKGKKPVPKRKQIQNFIVAIAVSAVLYIIGWMLIANLVVFGILIYLFYRYLVKHAVAKFQNKYLPRLIQFYRKILLTVIKEKRVYWVLGSCVLLFFLTLFILTVKPPEVVFFAPGDPDEIYVFITAPAGTHIDVTNQIAKTTEAKVRHILGPENPDVESILTNVAINAGSNQLFDRSTQDRLAKITITFCDYDKRTSGKSTSEYLNKLRKTLTDIPGAEIIVDKLMEGPPLKKPINIEIKGENLQTLIAISQRLKSNIQSLHVAGIEKLESDMETSNQEIVLEINRDKARQLGLNTYSIGLILRTSLQGSKVSKYREGEEEFPIRVRLDTLYRNNLDVLLSQTIEVSGRGTAPPKRIPLSAVVAVREITTYGGIIRKDNQRTITLSSNVLKGYNSNKIVKRLKNELKYFDVEKGYSISFTGEQSQQAEGIQFIIAALVFALGLILLIMVAQFNSLSKPIIIMTQIFFSFTGILFGLSLFGIKFSVLLSGLGIVAVGGVVATNGIILIDYMDRMMDVMENKKEAVITAAATRLTPVLLTALSTIFGLLPLASGINIDLVGLFSRLEPNIYFGGPNAAFWNPLAMALIFGLIFATFLTLIIEPVMYYFFFARNKSVE